MALLWRWKKRRRKRNLLSLGFCSIHHWFHHWALIMKFSGCAQAFNFGSVWVVFFPKDTFPNHVMIPSRHTTLSWKHSGNSLKFPALTVKSHSYYVTTRLSQVLDWRLTLFGIEQSYPEVYFQISASGSRCASVVRHKTYRFFLNKQQMWSAVQGFLPTNMNHWITISFQIF